MAHPGGRPPMYSNPEDLQKKIDQYFIDGMAKKTVIFKTPTGPVEREIRYSTISGLVRYCGFCDRHSFYAYEQIPEFSHTIKSARARIEEVYEQLMQDGLGAGAIFALKNFGWIDKQEIDQNVNLVSMPAIKKDGQPINLDIG